jgi:hypothetical protein
MLRPITVFLLLSLTLPALAQTDELLRPIEALIERSIALYDLSPANRLRLCAYAEMKGRPGAGQELLVLDFGGLGYLTFFEKNLLFRTTGRRIFHLNRFERGTPAALAFNQALAGLFDRIMLLGSNLADTLLEAKVDAWLMRKNLEPFEKLYVRHILLFYGKYDPAQDAVVFESRWHAKSGKSAAWGKQVRITGQPLAMRLDEQSLRGYFRANGGTVYVENVPERLGYASGERYSASVAAFKAFAQQLFMQSIPYVSQAEDQRLGKLGEAGAPVLRQVLDAQARLPQAGGLAPRAPVSAPAAPAPAPGLRPLYDADNWIPMMLTLLRSNGVNIGDPDVLPYFAGEPHFEKIYAMMTAEERAAADRSLQRL